MRKILLSIIAVEAFLLAGCSGILDPLPNGHYTDENFDQYPTVIRGFLIKSYSLLPTAYNGTEFAYLDCATDNAVARDPSNVMRRLGTGSLSQGDDPFASWWGRDYEGIYYANRFLENNVGWNTRLFLDPDTDLLARQLMQGEAYALRAWYQYDLLKKFGGKGTDGRYLGFPIITWVPSESDTEEVKLTRNTYEECVKQIVADCDSAYKYLPIAHRDQLAQDVIVQGARNWHRFDGISAVAIKAMTYLMWASPAFNPQNDITRWEKAAECAAQVMNFKINVDGTQLGAFNVKKGFQWTDPNSPETVWSVPHATSDNMEKLLYPNGFQGTGSIGATQELVDAFPAANGYPIDDPASGYNPENPYAGRDPRFYSTIFYHASTAARVAGTVMYTFNMMEGAGKDVAGLLQNSPTNYYVRKFIYSDWNNADATIKTLPRSVMYIRWTTMCLALAEAANEVGGPLDTRFGFSAKQAIGYLRSRETNHGKPGLGTTSDPYLDAVAAAGKGPFLELVKNERRLETCFEGERFFDLRRWATDLSPLNQPVSKAVITESSGETGTTTDYSTEWVENRNFTSRWLPIPVTEMRRSSGLVQNEGWDAWR